MLTAGKAAALADISTNPLRYYERARGLGSAHLKNTTADIIFTTAGLYMLNAYPHVIPALAG